MCGSVIFAVMVFDIYKDDLTLGLPIIKMDSKLKDFWLAIAEDISNPTRQKIRLELELARLKQLVRSKEVKRIMRVLINFKMLGHLRSFFSFSTCTNVIIIHRRMLLNLVKKCPEDAIELLFIKNFNSITFKA